MSSLVSCVRVFLSWGYNRTDIIIPYKRNLFFPSKLLCVLGISHGAVLQHTTCNKNTVHLSSRIQDFECAFSAPHFTVSQKKIPMSQLQHFNCTERHFSAKKNPSDWSFLCRIISPISIRTRIMAKELSLHWTFDHFLNIPRVIKAPPNATCEPVLGQFT